MKKILLLVIVSWLGAMSIDAQTPVSFQYLPRVRIDNDTLPHIDLPQVDIYPQAHFKSRQAEQQYWRLVGRVKKVYPYAKE
ncbi:MAG TPA: DUF4294 domain-containing protein, partial [Prolixibacteraceae bacterium]